MQVKNCGMRSLETMTQPIWQKVQEHLNKTGIPDADKVDVQINEGKATVSGDGLSQEAKKNSDRDW